MPIKRESKRGKVTEQKKFIVFCTNYDDGSYYTYILNEWKHNDNS